MFTFVMSRKAPLGEPEAGTDLPRQVGQMRKRLPSPGCGHFGERGPESSRCGGKAPGLSNGHWVRGERLEGEQSPREHRAESRWKRKLTATDFLEEQSHEAEQKLLETADNATARWQRSR